MIGAADMVRKWIENDPERRQALAAASRLSLPDWCLAAGFVRNLVWDKLHQFTSITPLNDIDLVYFDPSDISASRDRDLEHRLSSILHFPWSVKNQARMHTRNGDSPYTSTSDAMSQWVEVETAVGATLKNGQDISLISPFGLKALFELTVTLNPNNPKPHALDKRLCDKRWLETWPKLSVKK
ncbi:nitrate reductase [Halomonas sp. SL1]|nr:nitrate reductase [Halomonas sp. SL1]